MSKPIIAVAGAGAIGAVLAESLYQTYGKTVFAVADMQRIQRITSNGGIVINGKQAGFPYRCIIDDAVPADLLIIAVKGYHLDGLLGKIRPWVGENTQIISLLNGITSEEIIGERFGEDRIPLSLAVGQDALRRGYEITYTRKGKILIGEKSVPSSSPRVRYIRDVLAAGGVECEIPHNMKHSLWWKYMVNTGINQVSAVLDAPYADFQRMGEPREMMLSSIGEVRMIAKLEGIDLTDEDVAHWLDLLGTLSPLGETSMLQDVRAGRRTEVGLFSGTLIELARKHGVDIPVNRDLFIRLGGEKGSC